MQCHHSAGGGLLLLCNSWNGSISSCSAARVLVTEVTVDLKYLNVPLVHARCRVKVLIRHTYCALCRCNVILHLHDVCVVHVRQSSVYGLSKLVKWLWLSVTVV